jgi:hypothetical protein
MSVLASPLLLLAALALFRLWRATTDGDDRPARVFVPPGFVIRAAGGTLLVLVGYLSLPVAESLRGPRGLWFFANDGVIYLTHATAAARGGFSEIFTYSQNVSAIAYVKSLTLFVWSFGESPAVAVLLNLFCYLGVMGLVRRWARAVEAPRGVVLFTIAVFSLSPASILWALQPLKESFFQLIVVAVFAAAFAWQRAVQSGRPQAVLLASAAFLAALFALAGIRWYVAAAVIAGCVPYMAIVLWTSPRRRRLWLALALLPLLVLGGRAVVIGGGRLVLPSFRSALVLDGEGLRRLPVTLTWILPQVRENLAKLGGGTMIRTPDGAPDSHAERLGSGALAAFVPRTLLARFELLEIGGGRNLWIFADVDTLFFDAVLLASIVLCFRRRPASPVFWLIATAMVLTGASLLYVMPNFGTLFRLRLVLLTGCALLPLAWRSGAEKMSGQVLDPADADHVDVGVDLRGIRLRHDHPAKAESGGFARPQVGLGDAPDLAEEAHFAEQREVVREREIALR